MPKGSKAGMISIIIGIILFIAGLSLLIWGLVRRKDHPPPDKLTLALIIFGTLGLVIGLIIGLIGLILQVKSKKTVLETHSTYETEDESGETTMKVEETQVRNTKRAPF